MIYLFSGEGAQEKDKKIDQIKKKHLKSADALKFDFLILHSDKLNAAELKKSLNELPAIAKKRLIIIRAINKLSKQKRTINHFFLTLTV